MDFPLDEIVNYFIGQNKKTTFQDKHLEDNRLRYILLNLIYVAWNTTEQVLLMLHSKVMNHILIIFYPKSKLKHLPTRASESHWQL